MFKKIEIWILYLAILIGILFSIFFGILVRQELEGTIKLGKISKIALFLAEIPKNTKKLFLNPSELNFLGSDHISGFDGIPNEEEKYFLLSRFDGSLQEGIVELIDLRTFEVLHTWNPDFNKLNNDSDLNGKYHLKNLHRDFPEHSPTVILAGRFRKGGEIADKNIIHIGNVDYDDMPSLIDVSTATFTTESLLCNTLGSQKVLDSISRGVPVLCRKLDTFVSQLGDNYPCFYESENDAYDLAKNLLMDKDFSEDVRKFCLERSKYHSQTEVTKRFLDQPELKSLLEG